MPNIYSKITTTDKNGRSQNFDFVSLKYLSQDQFLENSSSRRYY